MKVYQSKENCDGSFKLVFCEQTQSGRVQISTEKSHLTKSSTTNDTWWLILLLFLSRYPWKLCRAWACSWKAQCAMIELFSLSRVFCPEVRSRHRPATPQLAAPSPCTSCCPFYSKASHSTPLG